METRNGPGGRLLLPEQGRFSAGRFGRYTASYGINRTGRSDFCGRGVRSGNSNSGPILAGLCDSRIRSAHVTLRRLQEVADFTPFNTR